MSPADLLRFLSKPAKYVCSSFSFFLFLFFFFCCYDTLAAFVCGYGRGLTVLYSIQPLLFLSQTQITRTFDDNDNDNDNGNDNDEFLLKPINHTHTHTYLSTIIADNLVSARSDTPPQVSVSVRTRSLKRDAHNSLVKGLVHFPSLPTPLTSYP